MNTETMLLLDNNDCIVAELELENLGNRYSGTIDLEIMPDDLKKLFEEYEELVTGQMFSLVEEVEDAIEVRCPRVQLADGTIVPIRDLQPNPSTSRVSLRFQHPINSIHNGVSHDPAKALSDHAS